MTVPTIPSYDLALLGHAEMLTNRFEGRLGFITRVYGPTVSGHHESVYIHGTPPLGANT